MGEDLRHLPQASAHARRIMLQTVALSLAIVVVAALPPALGAGGGGVRTPEVVSASR